MFGKGLAALGALVALMSFLSFAVLMDLVVTAQQIFLCGGLEITTLQLRPLPQIFVSLPQNLVLNHYKMRNAFIYAAMVRIIVKQLA